MDSPATYLLANRIWWAVVLFVGPIAGAVANQPLVGVGIMALLVLLSLLVFDTDRPWWSSAVRRLPQEPERSRSERRKLTLWSGIALLTRLGDCPCSTVGLKRRPNAVGELDSRASAAGRPSPESPLAP
jgi:hypothetical protein